MQANTFGHCFRLTTFGESHGESIGGIIDGCPAGLLFSLEYIQKALTARKPNPSLHGNVSTPRVEADAVRFHSGIRFIDDATLETLGTPIAFSVENTNVRSKDYSSNVFRPSHADYSYYKKFGIHGITGGGRASGRETVSRVIGGAIASLLLENYGIKIYAGTEALAGIFAHEYKYIEAINTPLYALDTTIVPQWQEAIQKAREDGDTIGGIVSIIAQGVPAGLGEPVFDKLDARLSYALMSVGAVKGVEIGAGFGASAMRGSQNNEPVNATGICASGGILGGISTGAILSMRVAVKPIPSIAKEQKSINIHGEECTLHIHGRHDCSAIPRIVPVLSSMVALTLIDFIMIEKTRK